MRVKQCREDGRWGECIEVEVKSRVDKSGEE